MSIICCLYSSVLSLQKPVNVRLMSRTVSGNEFQTEGPEAAKLRDPYRANRLRGIVRSWRAAEVDVVVDDTGVHMSVKYDGAMRRRHLNTIVPSLYWMRCRTGSQWRSWHMVSVMWSYLRFLRWVALPHSTLTGADASELHTRRRVYCCNSQHDRISGHERVSLRRMTRSCCSW